MSNAFVCVVILRVFCVLRGFLVDGFRRRFEYCTNAYANASCIKRLPMLYGCCREIGVLVRVLCKVSPPVAPSWGPPSLRCAPWWKSIPPALREQQQQHAMTAWWIAQLINATTNVNILLFSIITIISIIIRIIICYFFFKANLSSATKSHPTLFKP